MRRVGLLVALAGVALGAVARRAQASSGDGVRDPNGRGLHLLGGREAILLEQTEQARRTARARGLTLYRIFRLAALERRAELVSGDRIGGRALALATAVLARDLAEARALRAELDRVRAQRAAIRSLPESRADVGTAPETARLPFVPPFVRPVAGEVVVPFGVGRDAASGVWIFRAAASFAALSGETVRSPIAGRVARVSGSVAGGVAVVLSDVDRSWTVVLSGLASVAVAPGETVLQGEALGTAPGSAATERGHGREPASRPLVRVETWQGRSPVDPAAVMR